MPDFQYIGTHTQSDGTIDVKLPKCSHGEGPLEFMGVIPNKTVLSIGHPCHTEMLRHHRDVLKHPSQPNFKEI